MGPQLTMISVLIRRPYEGRGTQGELHEGRALE